MNDFYWVQRRPGINVFTIWSRSMIQEFGENFTGTEHEYEPTPRVLRPWPVLQLPPGISSDPPLGVVDETCFCNHIRSPPPVSHYDDQGNLRPQHEGEGRSVLEKIYSRLTMYVVEAATAAAKTENVVVIESPGPGVNDATQSTESQSIAAEVTCDLGRFGQ